MGQITADQSQAVMAVLSTNVRWASIDFAECDLQGMVLDNPADAGRQFAAFLRNGCRLVLADLDREPNALSINMPGLQRPSLKTLRRRYRWIMSIERDTSPESSVTLKLTKVVLPNEGEISGKDFTRRIAPRLRNLLGYQHCRWLLDHQKEYGEFMALLRKVVIRFPGLVVIDNEGNRRLPEYEWGRTRWNEVWGRLDNPVEDDDLIAVAGN